MNRSRTRKLPLYVKAAPLLLALFIIALPLLDPLMRARFVNTVLISGGVPWLIVLLAVGAAVYSAFKLERSAPAVAALVIGVMALVGYGQWRTWNQVTYYAATITASEEKVPTFKERAPHSVAKRQATSNLSGINGQVGNTSYLADSDQYTTLVDRKGLFNPGYTAIISQNIALTGQATGKPCLVDDGARDRMDGWFGNSLTRAIAAESTTYVANKSDAWGYCDTVDGEPVPKVVVPLTKLQGWLRPVHVPAGVAVYDGSTGDLQIHDEINAGELPGPAVGLSYSERVNDSLKSFGGSYWSTLMGQTGLTDVVKDDDDPNSGNSTNFSLAYKEADGSVFVSPFTSRASSRSIDAVSVLESGQVKAGEPAAATLHRLDLARQSNAATADKIKADFSDLPGWATGLEIMEVIPVSSDEWAASIGLNQNVVYRVMIKADGSSCLEDALGEPIRCTGEPTAGAPSESAPGSGSAELSGMTNEQLAQMQQDVTNEVLRRLSGK